MACVRYLKSGIDGNVESKLYNDLRDSYGDYIADDIYDMVYSTEFAASFGDWRNFPNKFKDVLDKNGELKIEAISPTPASNRLFEDLVQEGFIYPTAVNGLFPRNLDKTKGELMRFSRSYVADVRVVGDHVLLDGRSFIPSNLFVHNDKLIGAKQADIAAEKKWIEDKFGGKISFETTKRLVDGHAMGKFQKGAIHLYENAAAGTGYHEAFHATSQLFLTKAERESLYDEVRRRKEYKGKLLSNAQLEEVLADEFTEYVQSDGKYIVPEAAKEQKGFFKKLFDMIKEFFFGKKPSIREVYENITAGKYAKSLPLSTRALKYFEGSSDKSFYKTITLNNTDGTPLKINEKKKVVAGINKYFMDKLFEDGNPDKLFDKNIDLETLYDDVWAELYMTFDQNEVEGFSENLRQVWGLSPEQWATKWPELQSFYSNILGDQQQWNNLKDLHKAQLGIYGIQIEKEDSDDLDNNLESITLEQGRNNMQESVKYDTKDGAPAAVKILVGTLTKIAENGTEQINEFGLRELVDYNQAYDYLARNLSGIPSEWPIFKRKLEQLAQGRPEYKQLISRLSLDTKEAEHLRTKFVQAFGKTMYSYKVGLIDSLQEGGDIRIIDGNSSKLSDRIKDNWRGTFYTYLSAPYNYTVEQLLGAAEDYLDKAGDKSLPIQDRQAYIASAYAQLGIDFTDPNVLTKNLELPGGTTEKPAEMMRNIINYSRENKAKEADDLFGPKSGVAGRIKALAEIEAPHSKDIVELQHINSEGQTVYGITLNNYMTKVTSELNYIASMPTEEQRRNTLKERMPHLAGSLYTQNSLLLDKIINGQQINISVFDGFKYNSPSEQGKPTKDLGEADKYAQFFVGTLKGYYSYLRAADRGIENIVHIEGEKEGVMLTGKVKAYTAFTNYLYDEMATARALYDRPETNGGNIGYYKDMFNKDPHGLRAFSSIIPENNTAIRQLVTAKLSDAQFERQFKGLVENGTIDNALDKYFERRLKEEKGELERLELIGKDENGKVIPDGLSKDVLSKYPTFDEAVLSFIYNHQAMYIEQTKLFVGDLALYKTSDDAFKRFSMVNSTKKISRIGKDIDAFLAKEYPRLDGKEEGDRGQIKTIIYEDVEAKANDIYLNSLEKIFTKSLIEDGLGNPDKKTLNKKGKVVLAGMLAPYTDMEEGDAAGFITLDEYRDVLVRSGDWTTAHENAFSKLQEGYTLKSHELAFFQPLKTQYTGPIVGKEVEGNGVYVHAGYKHALTPLLPSMYKDSAMKKLMEHMTDNQVGIAQFRSGNKFGTLVNLKGKANDFYTEDNKQFTLNTDNLQYQNIDYKYFGVQLDMGTKVKEKITAGTQTRKLILANLFEKGATRSPELNEYASEYIRYQSAIIKKEVEELFEEMSIIPSDGGYRIADGSKMIKYLTKAAKGRNASDNIVEAIENLNILDADGTSIGIDKIDTLLNKEKVENLLMALMNNGIIKEKRKGGTKAQVPSSGYEFTARSKTGEMFTSNELAFYTEDKKGNLVGMEIAIPAPARLLKRYGSLDALNKALEKGKDKELARLTEIVGFRIPTQGMNSIDLLRIKKFLPAEMGDVIVLPTEIVAKSGADYDIDKLNLYMYEYSELLDKKFGDTALKVINKAIKEDGQEYSSVEEIMELIEEGDADFNSLDDIDKKAYRAYERLQLKEGTITTPHDETTKAGLKNNLLTVTKKILKDPHNRRQLLAPISDALLVDGKNIKNTNPVVNDVRNLEGKSGKSSTTTNIIEGKTNMEKFKYFLSGKAGVGQTAVHITHHVLTQIADTYIADKKSRLFFEYNTTTIEGEMFPSLGGIRDKAGNWITESLSAFMNAYVDIAKDPYIFDLNAGNETANTIFYMLRLGVDPKWLGRFMAQPSIQEYIKGRAISTSQIAKRFEPVSKKVDWANALDRVGAATKTSFSRTSSSLGTEIDKIENSEGDELLFNKLVSNLAKSQNNYIIPSMDQLANGITSRGKKLTSEEKALQFQVLDNFLDYQRQSNKLQKLIRASSPDTKGVGKNINTLLYRQKEKAEIMSSGFFGNAEAIFTNTFIGEFQKAVDAVTSTYSDLIISQHPSVVDKLNHMKDALSENASDTRQAERARNAVENEFIRFLINTASIKQGNQIDYVSIAMQEHFERVMGKNNPNNVVKRVNKLKRGVDEQHGNKLSDNLLIKELIPILDRKGQDNLKMFSRKVNTVKENDLVESFTEIYDIDPALAEDIAIVTLLQSGYSTSPITFTRFIPVSSAVNSGVQTAIKNAIRSVEYGNYIPDMHNFEEQFYRNNTSYIPSLPSKNTPEGWVTITQFNRGDALAKFPLLKKFKKNKEGKYEEIIYIRTTAPKDIKRDYRYVIAPDVTALGDGIFLSNYTIGENKATVFETEESKHCLK